MTSSQDFGRQGDIDAFIRKIKEQNEDTKKFEGILKKMGNVGERAENFLTKQDMLANRFNNPAGLPLDLYEAIMRQYGKEEQFGPYTERDAEMIRNAYKSGILA